MPDSTFGKPLLELKYVCWMNPWGIVENIPAHAEEIDVYILHVYKKGFNMNNKLEIKMCAVENMPAQEHDEAMQLVYETKWPLANRSKVTEKLIKEKVVTLKIDRQKLSAVGKDVALRLSVNASDG